MLIYYRFYFGTLVTPDMAKERPFKLGPIDMPPFYSLSTSLFLAQQDISGYVVSSHPSPEISCFSNKPSLIFMEKGI